MPSVVDTADTRSFKARLFGRKPRPDLNPGRKTLTKRRVPDEPPSYTVEPGNSFGDSPDVHKALPDPPPRYERQPRLTKPNPIPRTLQQDLLDKDTGERRDVTDLLHSLHFDETKHEVFETLLDDNGLDPTRPVGNGLMGRLDGKLWAMIALQLEPDETAALAITCRTLLSRLEDPFSPLGQLQNKHHRDKFLFQLDPLLPGHLYCFPCSIYHVRTHPGSEALKPPGVLNPLFRCPNATNTLQPPPRTRLTPARNLEFRFLQLVSRAHRLGPQYGLSSRSLARRWKDPSGWSHATQYHIHDSHILLRVTSQTFVSPGLTPAGQRLLLYSRDDYTPYFSVCAHWRDGVLLKSAKCAVGHIPVPPRDDASALAKRKHVRPPGLVSLCGDCSPMRRCPECPTEYLIELKLVEDRDVPDTSPGRFKQGLVVTRWSDLGDGINPCGREWSAVNGLTEGYDSFVELGNRAVSGWFESAMTDSIPCQRMLSLNPEGIKKGEKGNDWY